MLAHLDHRRPGVPFDPAEFWLNGWLWLDARHDQLAAVEAWHDDHCLGSVAAAALFERPDVNAAFGLPAGMRTGFAFVARHPDAPVRPFLLSLRGRLRNGSLTAPAGSSEVTPPDPARDPLLALRRHLAPGARGLEIGAHARPVGGLTPFFTDAVAAFAGTDGRVDFLSDALALPLPDACFDYLCSSHVLEHLPNTLAALHEWHRVLRPGGWLYLVVPDQRFTFDAPRATTSPRHFLSDFLHGVTSGASAAHIDEFVDQVDWSRLRPACPADQHAADREACRRSYHAQLRAGQPIDLHFHTFTPDSLRALLHAAGFIGSPRARFEIVVEAERYPPDRIDGIALLLRKRSAATPTAEPATVAWPHADPAIPPLPLVCPATLAPLHLAVAPDGTRSLTVAGSDRAYRHRGNLPVLLPPPETPVRRPWTSRAWRVRHHLAARLRLAFSSRSI